MVYCVKCSKHTDCNPNVTIHVAKNGREYQKSVCSVCGSNKIKFINNSKSNKAPPKTKIVQEIVNVDNDWEKKYQQRIQMINGDTQADGEGLRETITKAAKTVFNTVDALLNGIRLKASPAFKKTLKQYGNENIVSITVQRKPVQTVIKKIINFLTLGKFNKQVKSLNYEDIWHLSVILKLSSGVLLNLQKNAVPQLDVVQISQGEQLDVPIKNPVKLSDFIGNTVNKLNDSYWKYSAQEFNCQHFIFNHLVSNNLNNDTNKSFILQDAVELLSNDQKIINAVGKITDLGALTDVIIQGRGVSEHIGKFLIDLIKRFTNKNLVGSGNDPSKPKDDKDKKKKKKKDDDSDSDSDMKRMIAAIKKMDPEYKEDDKKQQPSSSGKYLGKKPNKKMVFESDDDSLNTPRDLPDFNPAPILASTSSTQVMHKNPVKTASTDSTSRPDWLVSLLDDYNHPRLPALPDLTQYNRAYHNPNVPNLNIGNQPNPNIIINRPATPTEHRQSVNELFDDIFQQLDALQKKKKDDDDEQIGGMVNMHLVGLMSTRSDAAILEEYNNLFVGTPDDPATVAKMEAGRRTITQQKIDILETVLFVIRRKRLISVAQYRWDLLRVWALGNLPGN